ncbi:hypothetical protein Gohar_004764 [Gossypium harknessii]|uniref:Uncharacterized protein n=1 Tax=Gossypium harknessii TaxID=34285 RepID=A0A7J9H786_9ROSI|nr:hypothetical protein [Gossypium harknessii]
MDSSKQVPQPALRDETSFEILVTGYLFFSFDMADF